MPCDTACPGEVHDVSAFAVVASLAALPALAAPSVVTDIPPVQSLVARVMQGVGEPASILPPGVTPHGYSMRPSEAARLEAADIVFWVGEGLTPWLEDAVGSLAADTVSVELMEAPGVALLEFSEERHADHDDDHGRKDEHACKDDDEFQPHVIRYPDCLPVGRNSLLYRNIPVFGMDMLGTLSRHRSAVRGPPLFAGPASSVAATKAGTWRPCHRTVNKAPSDCSSGVLASTMSMPAATAGTPWPRAPQTAARDLR